jgi:phosphoribosyl-ATP pyrophosphohydrolase
MTDIPMEKLVDRIKKMHAKAESAKALGNEAEAFAFASAVSKLLLKHNLEMTDVEAALAMKEDPVKAHYFRPEVFGFKRKKTRVLWSELLAHVVADAHMCGILPCHASNELMIIGTRQNRQACEFMIVFLTRYAEEHAEKDYVTYFYRMKYEGDVTKARGYKAGWLMGFVSRLAERYKADKMQVIKEAEQVNPYALVRLKDQLVKVNEVIDVLATGKGKPPKQRALDEGSSAGVEHGMAHGDKVQLKGMGIHRPKGSKGLGPGQGMLGSGS